MQAPLIKVKDIAYITYEHSDLDAMSAFLKDFGLSEAYRDSSAIYMRGAASTKPVYIARRANQSRFASVAFEASSRSDLDLLTAHAGASPVQPLRSPGGGEFVTIVDPDGFHIEVVWGIEGQDTTPSRDVVPINYGTQKNRKGEVQRIPKKTPEVMRLGHMGISVRNFAESFDFYSRVLGLLPSDCLFDGDEKNVVGAFLRCDQGDSWVDHHSLAVFEHPNKKSHIHHASFEMQDIDSVIFARDWLNARGWNSNSYWGVGRHVLGSQVFDYWRDPSGHLIEHYADGDVCNAATESRTYQRSPDLRKQWGPEVPSTFMD